MKHGKGAPPPGRCEHELRRQGIYDPRHVGPGWDNRLGAYRTYVTDEQVYYVGVTSDDRVWIRPQIKDKMNMCTGWDDDCPNEAPAPGLECDDCWTEQMQTAGNHMTDVEIAEANLRRAKAIEDAS